MFGREIQNSMLSDVWMPLRCWYHNSQIGTWLFKVHLLLYTQMILISYSCFFITITIHLNWKIIFLIEMTRKSDHQQRKCYSIREFISQLLKRGEPTLLYLLFARAFSGCSTTSASTDLGRLPFSKSSKTQNDQEILVTSSTKMGKIPKNWDCSN